MPVEVEFHPATYKEFFQDVLSSYPDLLQKLRRDFSRYVESDGNFLPTYFGQDAPYVEPAAAFNARLMHIHICLPPGSFPIGKPQADRKCRKGEPSQDAALVYVRGELYEERYRLLAFLHPDAHQKARKKELMSYLARIAQEFRDQN
ncbi:type II toxin-antitoxin system YafO family toxin [Metapseudomonas otitidis]|uniref:type II toxin-antitoxin system YafO family toxin n=1 Tax=Metapseudomonas otitidis TaxID=319939 RepID=UPI0013F65C79|nr:type II toxin-antitoxin system YafO family toxin [Pseudomonas otitidis]